MAPVQCLPSPFGTVVGVGTGIADLFATPIAAFVLEEFADDAECQAPPPMPLLCQSEQLLLGIRISSEIVELDLPC